MVASATSSVVSVVLRRSRMVSFRLSPEEYESLTSLASERGIGSISGMARFALRNLATADDESDTLTRELRDLRSQFRTTARELERFSEILESRGVGKGEPLASSSIPSDGDDQ